MCFFFYKNYVNSRFLELYIMHWCTLSGYNIVLVNSLSKKYILQIYFIWASFHAINFPLSYSTSKLASKNVSLSSRYFFFKKTKPIIHVLSFSLKLLINNSHYFQQLLNLDSKTFWSSSLLYKLNDQDMLIDCKTCSLGLKCSEWNMKCFWNKTFKQIM